MEFQRILRKSSPRTLNTEQGALIQFPGGGIGMVIQSSDVSRGANDYSVVILSGKVDRIGNVRHCMRSYDRERVNIDIIEAIKYTEVTS
ncbi:hypothetical protein LCGC14_2705880 [marine sediment metagenome]|uniref:Uncharacterized protein n=1 Tax=marine sediment metagenome TaxID=412755 RepID=A0A0F9C654_9ZZZZ